MKNDDYEDIVTNFSQPMLVLAGPGAGKTYLLADRTKRLLDVGTDKNSIMLLTFGKDACQNMRDKLLDTKSGFEIPYERLPHVATLHGLSFEIVNRKPHSVGLQKTNLSVQSNEDVKKLLFRDASLILGLSESEAIAALKYKQNGEFEKKTDKSLYSICEKYWEIMSKCNCIDFDDQVNFACLILETDGTILEEYQAKCKHLLVDEYQDINAAQFKLIKLLSEQSREGLFTVGDDAQSIYGFRGADPTYILNFAKDYPNAKYPPLAHSRRCSKPIMEDASRMLKAYYSEWIGPYDLTYHVPSGDKPSIWLVASDKAEAEWIARIARQSITEKKTVLVLAPKREFFPSISLALQRYGVPHECPVNLLPKSVNDRLSTIFDILEWLKKPEDSFLTRLAIESLMNYGKAKVPGADKSNRCTPKTIKKRIGIETEVAQLWDSVGRKKSLFAIFREKLNLSIELEIIRESLINLSQLYSNTSQRLHGEFAKQLFLSVGGWAESQKLTSDLSLIIEQLKPSKSTGFGSVQLMTMRKAKGLEADVVVIAGLEDDLMPNPISDIEEEARLFYVSMTRAKEKLYLLHAFKRLRSISYGPEITSKRRSRFIESIGRKSIYKR